MKPPLYIEGPDDEGQRRAITDRTPVSLGVVWTLLIAVIAGAGLALSVKMDLLEMQIQAKADRAVIHMIAHKVGVDLP